MKRLSLLILLFSISLSTAFSFEATLSVGQDSLREDEILDLRLEIKPTGEQNEDVVLEEIRGLENFDIINSSKSSRSSSKIVSINGEVKKETEMIHLIRFSLDPKTPGTFSIGPATLSGSTEKKDTNSVDIEIKKSPFSPSVDEEKEKQKVENTQTSESNSLVESKEKPIPWARYIFSIFGIFALMSMIFLFAKREKESKIQLKEESELASRDTFVEETPEITEYPELDDAQFAVKMRTIFLQKLSKKYFLPYNHNTALSEYVELLSLGEEEQKEITDIVTKLQKLQYSNILTSKANIKELIKNFS